jgi:hypothetical protein
MCSGFGMMLSTIYLLKLTFNFVIRGDIESDKSPIIFSAGF